VVRRRKSATADREAARVFRSGLPWCGPHCRADRRRV